MGVNKYSAKVWEDTTANWANDHTIYEDNDLLFDSELNTFKRGDGINQYSTLPVIGGASISPSWGNITGTLSSQSDLQTQLDNKLTKTQLLTGNSPQLTFGSVQANSFIDLGFNISGAAIGDIVALGIPGAAQVDGAIFIAMVSNTNVIDIRCVNVTSSAINVPGAIYKVTVFKV